MLELKLLKLSLAVLLFFGPVCQAEICGSLVPADFEEVRKLNTERLLELKRQIESRSSRIENSTEKLQVQSVREIVECMLEKNSDFTVEMIEPQDPSSDNPSVDLMSVREYFWLYRPNKVYVSSVAAKYNKSMLASIVVHELSHLCGTDDLTPASSADEFINRCSVNSNPDSEMIKGWKITGGSTLGQGNWNWEMNAEHYRIWSLYGFCVPGPDCQDFLGRK